MTAQEIIEKIRDKIESKIRDTNNDTSVGAMESLTISKTLHDVLSILSDLEKEEKPMNPQPVKIDIRKELASIEFMGVNDARDSETIARHFYELGLADKKEQMMKETVEGYICATNEVSAVLALPKGDFKKGEKVRIIIVKED